jgi:hypothetical protein
MPLQHSSSDAAFKANVPALMREIGKSPHVQSRDQALAIAYAIKRRGKAHGGEIADVRPIKPSPKMHGFDELLALAQPPADSTSGKTSGFALGGAPAPWQVRSEARSMLHSGPIMSAVPGRTDRHNMSVASGSYVVPAQAVSHLGQSNTIAGMKVLNSMFGSGGPYGSGSMAVKHGAGAPHAPKAMKPLAEGGGTDQGGARENETGAPVDVITAGGEYVIPPEGVHAVGNGDMKHGHNVLDAWVNSILDDHIKTLKKLPGPAKG